MNSMGITPSFLLQGSRIVYRSGVIRGITRVGVPSYLSEVAILHSLRLVQNWYRHATAAEIRAVQEAGALAGNDRTISALGKWAPTGTLALESFTVSPLIEDLSRLGDRLEIPIRLFPCCPPTGRELDDMPLTQKGVLTQMRGAPAVAGIRGRRHGEPNDVPGS